MIKHYSSCNSSYPEKPEGELPQQIIDVDIGEGEVARTCCDCGAFEIVVDIQESRCQNAGVHIGQPPQGGNK